MEQFDENANYVIPRKGPTKPSQLRNLDNLKNGIYEFIVESNDFKMHKWRQFEHKTRSLQDVKEVDIFYMDARSPYYFVQMIGSKQIHMARESNFPMEKAWVEFSYFLSQHNNSSIADLHIFIKTQDKIYMLLNPAKFVYRTDFINDEQIEKFNKDTFFDLEKKMLQHLGLERQLSWVANNDIVITQEGKLLLVNLSWKKDNFDEVIDYVSQRAKIEVEEITEFIFPHSIALDCITSLDIFQHIAFFDKKVFVKTVRCSRTGEFYLQTDYFVSGNNDIKKFLQSTGKYTEAEIFVWENKDRDNHNFLLPYSKYSGLTFPYFIRKFDAEDLKKFCTIFIHTIWQLNEEHLYMKGNIDPEHILISSEGCISYLDIENFSSNHEYSHFPNAAKKIADFLKINVTDENLTGDSEYQSFCNLLRDEKVTTQDIKNNVYFMKDWANVSPKNLMRLSGEALNYEKYL